MPGVSSGVAPIFVESSSQNSILIIKGANQYLLPVDIEKAANELKKCSLIVLQLEIRLETVYYAIDFGKKYGIPVLLNPAPAVKELDVQKISGCEFFIPNESELSLLTGMPVNSKKQAEAAAAVLLDQGIKNVIVTLGSKGVLWVRKEGVDFIEAHSVNAVDTTGAGDAFIGCFSAIYVEKKDVLEALCKANAYAALSVQKKGTQLSYPEKVQLIEFLNDREM